MVTNNTTERGERGERGPQGDSGQPATIGERGPKGNDGLATTGERGPKGDDGQRGQTGLAGEPGIIGLTGYGERGPTGDHGQDGRQGLQGVSGPAGLTGSSGLPGNTGATGVRGAAGSSFNRRQILTLMSFVLFVFVLLAWRSEVNARHIGHDSQRVDQQFSAQQQVLFRQCSDGNQVRVITANTYRMLLSAELVPSSDAAVRKSRASRADAYRNALAVSGPVNCNALIGKP